MSDEKTVLVLFRGRRRPITFRCDEDPKTENDNLLGAAIDGFQDIISSNEGPSTSTSTNTFYLQRESEKWNGLIDVIGSVQENEMIYLCLQSEMTSTASQVHNEISYSCSFAHRLDIIYSYILKWSKYPSILQCYELLIATMLAACLIYLWLIIIIM